MSYHVYTTEGIILKKAPFGEANLLLYILTADLGLIIASAQSARVSASKLRSALQEFTHVTISCVKGKGGWRVVNVAQIQNFYFDGPEYVGKTLAQVVSLLIKMIPGESNQPGVFYLIKDAFVQIKNIDKKDIEYFEILVVLRLLFELGYVDKNSVPEKYFRNDLVFSEGILVDLLSDKKLLVQVINNSLKESQL